MDAQNIDDTEYLMEDMTILPDIMTLDACESNRKRTCLWSQLIPCSQAVFWYQKADPGPFSPQFGGNCYPFNLYNIHLHFLVHQVLIC